MQPADYRRIESELQQQIRQSALPNTLGESLSRKGWSTGCLGILSFYFNVESVKYCGFRWIQMTAMMSSILLKLSAQTRKRMVAILALGSFILFAIVLALNCHLIYVLF